MLGLLLILTFSAPDLNSVETSYNKNFGYEVAERGQVSPDLAKAWGTPNMEGRDFTIMRPEQGGDSYIRFVQNPAISGVEPMKTFGWSAGELLVQDLDDLAKRLRAPDSGFQILGEPRTLSATSKIRAMQAVGPAGEVLYLTQFPATDPDGALSSFRTARSYVDRAFIAVVGGPDLEAMRTFYGSTFGRKVSEPGFARITILNKANNLDIDTVHPVANIRITDELVIEFDKYPEAATTRPHRHKMLPPGMAMVTITVDNLDDFKGLWLSDPIQLKQLPYGGRRTATIKGVADELIELVEQKRQKRDGVRWPGFFGHVN